MDREKEMELSRGIRQDILTYQRNEITEYHIYCGLAERMSSPQNKEVLTKIANEELGHYRRWKAYSGQDVPPDRFKIWKYSLLSRLFGFTFGVKLMEKGEEGAQENYAHLGEAVPEALKIAEEENEHEAELLQLLDEERLRYTGSIVLGLNDALVELTGALAGLTLALQNTRLIALTGLITGIAAALSMGASEYLSTKAEGEVKNPIKASVYTGITYILTVFILILPYLLIKNYYLCLGCTLVAAVSIIALFNYYISVAQDLPFRRRFLEMVSLSFGVAAFSFFIGFLIRAWLGVEI